jgi:hypothetical protein
MSRSRGQRVKAMGERYNDVTDYDVFYMDLQEAKNMIADQYQFLAERYERRKPRKMKPNQG